MPSSPKEKPFSPAANVASSWSPVENVTLLSTNRVTSEFILTVVSVSNTMLLWFKFFFGLKTPKQIEWIMDHHKGSKAKANKN